MCAGSNPYPAGAHCGRCAAVLTAPSCRSPMSSTPIHPPTARNDSICACLLLHTAGGMRGSVGRAALNGSPQATHEDVSFVKPAVCTSGLRVAPGHASAVAEVHGGPTAASPGGYFGHQPACLNKLRCDQQRVLERIARSDRIAVVEQILRQQ